MMTKTERVLLENFFKDIPFYLVPGGVDQFTDTFNDLGTHFVMVNKKGLPIVECAQRGYEARYLTIYHNAHSLGANVDPNFPREVHIQILDLMLQTSAKLIPDT